MDDVLFLEYGDERLKQVSERVEDIHSIKNKISQLVAAMYSFKQISIAAPQINWHKQVILFDHEWIESKEKYKNLHVLINPEIIEESIEDIGLYECSFSFPKKGLVYRPKTIKVKYDTLKNKTKTKEFTDIEARLIQHSMDFLKGEFFIEKMAKREKEYLLENIS